MRSHPVPLLIACQSPARGSRPKGLLATTIWRVSGAALAVVIIAVLCYRRKTTIALEEPLSPQTEKPSLWRAGPFLVAVAAAPSASEVLANVRYERFQGRPCVLPSWNAAGPSRRCLCVWDASGGRPRLEKRPLARFSSRQ